MELDERLLSARNPAEIGPDHVIENMGPERCDRLRQAMDLQRSRAGSAHRIDHQRQRRHMVQVGVGQQDVLNAPHLVQRQIPKTGTSVDQDVPIQQK